MKLLPLSQGKEAMVDDEDFDFLCQWNWVYHQGYAKRWHNGRLQPMNAFIAEQAGVAALKYVDGDRLNNCRCNLAEGVEGRKTRSDSGRSRSPYKKRGAFVSGFKGVMWNRRTGKWRVQVIAKGERFYLGEYDDKRFAASVYNKAAKEKLGENAYLNPL